MPDITAKEVSDIINESGVSAVFRIYATDVFDPETNSQTKGTLTNHTEVVIPPYDDTRKWGPSVLVASGKAKTGVAVYEVTFTPVLNQEIVISSVVWKITGILPIGNNQGLLVYLLEIESLLG